MIADALAPAAGRLLNTVEPIGHKAETVQVWIPLADSSTLLAASNVQPLTADPKGIGDVPGMLLDSEVYIIQRVKTLELQFV